MRPSGRAAAVLAGTAVVSFATIVEGAGLGHGLLVVVGFGLLVVSGLWIVLTGPRPHEARRKWRPGALTLAAALGLALYDRHQLVAARGVAPDDIAAAAALLACVVVAARAPARASHPALLGLVLTAYLLVGAALVAGTDYQSDAVANVHRAAEELLAGRDPYRAVDTVASLQRFGLDRALATDLEDGSPLRSYNYPALSFLIPAPAQALGLDDVRILYLALVTGAAACAIIAVPRPSRPLVLAAIVGNVVLLRQHVLAGVDPLWVILLGASLLALGRSDRGLWLPAVLLGLAAAARQPAWFAAPFVLYAVWRDRGPRPAGTFAALALGVFLIPQLPFVVGAPVTYLEGILAPLLLPLEAHGVGLVRLGLEGLAPLAPRGVFAAASLVALVALLGASRRAAVGPGLGVLALAPLYLAWRSLQSYLAPVSLFGALAVAQEDRDSG